REKDGVDKETEKSKKSLNCPADEMRSKAVADEINPGAWRAGAQCHQLIAKPSDDKPAEKRDHECKDRKVAELIIDEFDGGVARTGCHECLKTLLPPAISTNPVNRYYEV